MTKHQGPALNNWHARNKTDLIIEVWEALDCESVGARELEFIQHALEERFGDGARESPAAIARAVADEGAVLRHPEVFECDRAWRERELTRVLPVNEIDVSSLEAAAGTINKLELVRRDFERGENGGGIRSVRAFALALKRDALLVARSRTTEEIRKREAAEIAQWLTVWLQEPEMFEDWLSLRRRSKEFRGLMGLSDSEPER